LNTLLLLAVAVVVVNSLVVVELVVCSQTQRHLLGQLLTR
jgi:hypothetical protein